jgi:hypothetical protein
MAGVHPPPSSPGITQRVFGPSLPGPRALWASSGRRALSAGCCVALPLAVGLALGRGDLGSAAGMGGMTAIYGHALPFRPRAVALARIAAGLVAVSGLGAVAGPHPVVLALVCGVMAAGAAAATAAWRTGPPGPLGFLLVGGGASALGATPAQLGGHLLATAAGAALAWAVCMLPWLWDPDGPERRAVAVAEDAVAAAERGALATVRPGAVARAVRLADAAVGGGTRRGGSRRRDALADRLRAVEERFFAVLPHGDAPVDGRRPLERVAEPLRPHPWSRLPWLPGAVRLGAAAATGGLVAVAVGLPSPYWAATTSVAVLLGTDARHTRARAVHRITGTVVGVLVAAGLLWLDLPVGVEVLLVGLLQVAVELLVTFQYVLAVAAITPLALLLVHVGNPVRPDAELITSRLGETVVGIVVALLAGRLVFPRAASRRLPSSVSAAARRALEAADAAAGGPADRALHDALVTLHEVATAARAEFSPAPGSSVWLRRSRRVGDLGWALLGARARGDRQLAQQVAGSIHADLGPA